MRNLKFLKAALVIIVLSILIGCSDQITSSGETGLSEKDKEADQNIGGQGLPVVETFKTVISLKPFSAYKFDQMSTGYDKFYSIDIQDIQNSDAIVTDCRNLLVYNSKSVKERYSCHSRGFDVSELTIENTGAKFRELQVILSVFKQKKNPINELEQQ